MGRSKTRTILVGQAEEIDQVPKEIREMIANQGLYIGIDTNHPGVEIPVVSINGKIYAVEMAQTLDPTRFLPTAIFSGPFRAGDKVCPTSQTQTSPTTGLSAG